MGQEARTQGPLDAERMERALTLAAEAAAFASPNPAVGCVLARGAEVLGEGAHVYSRRDHAEVAALRAAAEAGRDVRGATAYVTLEPCAHHGRTGPCSEALVAAGIARCVVATVDPNPVVRERGLEKMRAAGVAVEVLSPSSPLAQQARSLNLAFAFAIQHGRPFVTLKSALSTDGRIAPAPATRRERSPVWLTGAAARADVQRLRHESDALLTGVGTVLADNPALTDRTGLGRGRPLLRVVLDTHLRTPAASRLVAEACGDVLLLCAEDASEACEAGLRAAGSVEVVRLPCPDGQRPGWSSVLRELQARGVRSLLVEAGSAVNGSLLLAGLADRVVLYFAEAELGPGAVPFAASAQTPFTLMSQLEHTRRLSFPAPGRGDDIRISGLLHDPWAGI